MESPWSALGTSASPTASPPSVPSPFSSGGDTDGFQNQDQRRENRARGAEEEHPGPVEGGSAIRAGDRPVPTPRAPSQTLGGRARSPALPAGPVAAVTAVPVAADSPGGLLGDHPQPPTRLFGTGQSRRSGRCHISRVVSPSDGGKGVRESRGRWREVRCHLRRGLKRGPVELDGAGSSQSLSWEGGTGQDRGAERGGVHPVPTPCGNPGGDLAPREPGDAGTPWISCWAPPFPPCTAPLGLVRGGRSVHGGAGADVARGMRAGAKGWRG